MIEKFHLQSSVDLLGKIPHSKVREILIQGDIFLNCSLTEAFCMAILEAASCGLYIISTNVGGVPEVLPPSLISLVPPTSHDLINSLKSTIIKFQNPKFCAQFKKVNGAQIHHLHDIYNWYTVAKRTNSIYQQIMNKSNKKETLIEQLNTFYENNGLISAFLFIMVYLINVIIFKILDYIEPSDTIEKAPHLTFRAQTKMAKK